MITHKADLVQDHIVYNGKAYHGSDALGRVCRKIKTGTLNLIREGMLCLTVDVQERTKVSLYERDRGSAYEEYRAPTGKERALIKQGTPLG